MARQLGLLDAPCLACAAPCAVLVLETATFIDYEWTKAGVSEQWDCAACGSSVFTTARPQPSPWVEAVWAWMGNR